jgi:hypothetical protein
MMSNSVLLDTTFLISLVDDTRPNHTNAKGFYKYFIDNKIAMILSSIVTSEFCVKQQLTDLPLKNFKTLPFNIPDSYHLSHLFLDEFKGQLEGSCRAAIKDDFKIVSQCSFNKITHFITEDQPLCNKLRSLKSNGKIQLNALYLPDGYRIAFGLPQELF